MRDLLLRPRPGQKIGMAAVNPLQNYTPPPGGEEEQLLAQGLPADMTGAIPPWMNQGNRLLDALSRGLPITDLPSGTGLINMSDYALPTTKEEALLAAAGLVGPKIGKVAVKGVKAGVNAAKAARIGSTVPAGSLEALGDTPLLEQAIANSSRPLLDRISDAYRPEPLPGYRANNVGNPLTADDVYRMSSMEEGAQAKEFWAKNPGVTRPPLSYGDWDKKNTTNWLQELFGHYAPGPGPLHDVSEQVLRPVVDEVPGKILRATKNKGLEKRLQQAVTEGTGEVPMQWYDTGQLLKEYQEAWGPQEGLRRYGQHFNTLAGTSPQMPVPSNIKVGSHYNYQLGLNPDPSALAELPPSGYGSSTQRTARGLVEGFTRNPLLNYTAEGARQEIAAYAEARKAKMVQKGIDLKAAKTPEEKDAIHAAFDEWEDKNRVRDWSKTRSFGLGLMGNRRNMALDRHAIRAVGILSGDPEWLKTSVQLERTLKDGTKQKYTIRPRDMVESGEMSMKEAQKDQMLWQDAPADDAEYGLIEKWLQGLADKVGIAPTDWQGKLWFGMGKRTGLASAPETYMESLAKRAAYTGYLHNRDPKQILRQYILGEIPLNQLLGPLLGGGAAAAAAAGSSPKRDSDKP